MEMKGKGTQFVAHGRRVQMAFPGGAGHGVPRERAMPDIRRDLAHGYITAEVARDQYGLTYSEIDDILARAKLGEVF